MAGMRAGGGEVSPGGLAQESFERERCGMESVREWVVNSSRALECVRERRGEREQAGSGWFGSRSCKLSSVKQAPAVSQSD